MLTQNLDFNDYFYYDETSPSCLRWKVDRFCGKLYKRKHVSAGDVVGCRNKKGYWTFSFEHKHYQVHRVIAEMLIQSIENEYEIDHINKNTGDNRLKNLRVVERTVNLRNKGMYLNNKTGATGVCLNTKTNQWGTIQYWVARWYDISGVLRGKHFRLDRLGSDEAFRLACEYRAKMIQQLNEQGASYSDTHGQ